MTADKVKVQIQQGKEGSEMQKSFRNHQGKTLCNSLLHHSLLFFYLCRISLKYDVSYIYIYIKWIFHSKDVKLSEVKLAYWLLLGFNSLPRFTNLCTLFSRFPFCYFPTCFVFSVGASIVFAVVVICCCFKLCYIKYVIINTNGICEIQKQINFVFKDELSTSAF